jgi:hypothetical protein
VGVRRNWWGNRLRLRVAGAGKPSGQSFLFPGRRECRQWQDRLLALTAGAARGDAAGAPERVQPVVLLRRRPEMRHQVLGVVEYKGAKARRARAGLQLRAAMMGADAVVDVQEERLPGFWRTVRRASGTAIRAVDQDGRLEVRSRWFAEEASRVGSWMLVLVGVSAVVTVLSSLFLTVIGVLGAGASPLLPDAPLAPGETFVDRLATTAAVVGLIHAWPFAVALLARLTLWPQLLRPAALAVLALVARSLALFLGLVATSVWTGRWEALPHLLLFLDPSNLAILVFGWFVYRRAVSAYADYRALVPDDEHHPALARRAISRAAAWFSPAFAALLVDDHY